jgi:hypothetical protein
MRSLAFSALITFALAATACQSTTKNATERRADQRELQRHRPDFSALISAAEKLRDRDFSRPPILRGVTQLSVSNHTWRSGEQQDIDILKTTLFASVQSPWESAFAAPNRIARYAPKRHLIEYLEDHRNAAQIDQSILFSLVQALDRNHLKPNQEHVGFDSAVAYHTRSTGPAMFVLALHEARKIREDFAVTTLADRPELLDRLDTLNWIFTSKNNTADNIDALGLFALRQGFSLTAALFRSGGWSAVEWLHHQSLRSTQNVVRPDRWLAGKDIGTWEWPAGERNYLEDHGWTLSRESRVGPAAIASWQSRFVGAKASRTLYNHWRGGAFRFWTTRTGSWHWQWVTQWDTPSSSTEVSAAFRRGLQSSPAGKCTVNGDGLRVAVVCTAHTTSASIGAGTGELLNARIRYNPQEPKLFSFRKAGIDRYLERAKVNGIGGAKWIDKTFVHDLELPPQWSLVESQTLPVRWLASHEDGTQLLLSVELKNPLGAAFGSSEYRQAATRAISSTTNAFALIASDYQPDATIEYWQIHFGRMIDARREEVKLWQFHLGDEIVNLSLQAAPSSMARHQPVSRAIVKSLQPNTAHKHIPSTGRSTIEFSNDP